jgi:hypothetical protein
LRDQLSTPHLRGFQQILMPFAVGGEKPISRSNAEGLSEVLMLGAADPSLTGAEARCGKKDAVQGTGRRG